MSGAHIPFPHDKREIEFNTTWWNKRNNTILLCPLPKSKTQKEVIFSSLVSFSFVLSVTASIDSFRYFFGTTESDDIRIGTMNTKLTRRARYTYVRWIFVVKMHWFRLRSGHVHITWEELNLEANECDGSDQRKWMFRMNKQNGLWMLRVWTLDEIWNQEWNRNKEKEVQPDRCQWR